MGLISRLNLIPKLNVAAVCAALVFRRRRGCGSVLSKQRRAEARNDRTNAQEFGPVVGNS